MKLRRKLSSWFGAIGAAITNCSPPSVLSVSKVVARAAIASFATVICLAFAPYSLAATPHDLSGDLKSDLILRNTGTGEITARLMNGTTISSAANLLANDLSWGISHITDFNGDGRADLLWRNTNGAVVVWLMNGTTVISSVLLLGPEPNWQVSHVGDFNGDGKSDILWRNTNGAINLWLMNGTTVTSALGLLVPNPDWQVSHIGDFNGDGKSDILWRNTNGAVNMWLMNGGAVSSALGLLAPNPDWQVSHIGDFNGDGKSDILWRNTNGAVNLWLMNGGVVTSSAGLLGPNADWRVSHTADFNGDGRADILWRNSNGAVNVWLMFGTSIANATSLLGPDPNWSVTHLGDFNGDGKSDIVWRNASDGSVAMWLMNGATATGSGLLAGPGTLEVVPVAQEVRFTPVGSAWSNPATWGGTVPPAGASVIIPAGKTVLLDSKVNVKGLTINGTLACGGSDIAIDADWVVVSGKQAKLSCGTKANPYTGKFTLELNGPNTDDIMGMGARVLGAMDGATLELFGEPRTAWTKLNATANKGANTLTLAGAPAGWRAGMDIVIGSSSENPREAEVRRIQSINGNTITLASALAFSHFGEQQTYSNGKRTWTVDTRAPVGLLSHNITIQGAADSTSTQFGAHVMSMVTAKSYISDVSFNRVGQKSLIGRYPFHWHLAGNVAGQSITRSSIWESYNRCFTIHGTDNALVDNNVCYNHIGHGYFLEDGTEQGNTITGNLGVLTIKPKDNEAILPTDNVVSPATAGPATFWISNPQNTVRNNHANGSEGSGIWNFFENRNMTRYDGTTVNPRNLPFVEQADNTVSSSEMGLVACEIKGGTQGVGGPGTKAINRFTAFMTKRSGLWPCGSVQEFDDARLLDSGNGDGFRAAFVAPQRMLVKNSLFVANSRLKDMNGGNKPRRAFGSYDQGSILQDSHFVGYTTQTQSAFVSFAGGAVKDYTSRMQGLSFDPPQPAAFEASRYDSKSIVDTFSVLNDLDGSLGAGSGMTLMPRSAFTDALGCSTGQLEANTFGALCPARIVRTRAEGLTPQNGDVVVFLSRGGQDIARQAFNGVNGDPGNSSYLQFVSIPNKDYHLGAEFNSDPGGNFYLQIFRASPGDVIRYELRNLRPNTRITNSDIAQVNSLQDLERSTSSVWFRSGTTVHFKVVMSSQGQQWDTTRAVNFGD